MQKMLCTIGLALIAGCGMSNSSGAPAPVAAVMRAHTSGMDVLRLMHDRYSGSWYSTLSFTQTTDIRLPNDSLVHQTWYETAKLPGRLRINRLANDDQNVTLFRADSVYSRRNGAAFQGHKYRNDLMTLGFDVYTEPVERSAEILTEEGYDLSKLSESTWQGRPVWVVGASAGDSTTRQFWVDKGRLLYVRSIERGLRDSTATADVVFGQYEPLAGGWIAKEVTVTEGGKVIQRELYRDIKANSPVSDDYFDPARIR